MFPNDTGPELLTKATTFDPTSNTSQFFRGADWNDMRTLLHAVRNVLVGSYRGYVEVRSSGTLTAVRVRTAAGLIDGHYKTVASGRVLIPGITGTTIVAVQWNQTSAAPAVYTAATAPAAYSTGFRQVPLARVRVTGGVQTVEPLRPDWILFAGL